MAALLGTFSDLNFCLVYWTRYVCVTLAPSQSRRWRSCETIFFWEIFKTRVMRMLHILWQREEQSEDRRKFDVNQYDRPTIKYHKFLKPVNRSTLWCAIYSMPIYVTSVIRIGSANRNWNHTLNVINIWRAPSQWVRSSSVQGGIPFMDGCDYRDTTVLPIITPLLFGCYLPLATLTCVQAWHSHFCQVKCVFVTVVRHRDTGLHLFITVYIRYGKRYDRYAYTAYRG